MHVTLSDTDRLEVVLKKFNRQITKAGLFQDMKKNASTRVPPFNGGAEQGSSPPERHARE